MSERDQVNIPFSIQQSIAEKLNFKIISFSSIAGGCINHGGKLSTNAGDFFLKWNDASRYPGMFEAEKKGLNILRETNTVHVPDVFLNSEIESWQFIVMEFVNSRTPSKGYWEKLGTGLAALHKHSSSYFGLDHDNYIGSLKQRNTCTKKWIEFFIQHRLSPQLKMLRDSNRVDENFISTAEKIYPKLSNLIPEEPSALLHGDLWSGNVIINSKGAPSIIDPAVYYGHREAEIAFTRLFGGFEKSFYEAYGHHFPLTAAFEQRIGLYNLYPLLVHANIFGQNYLSRVRSIIAKYA